MNSGKTKRLTTEELRLLMLSNAKTLTAKHFKTRAPEIAGQKKASIPSN